MKSCETHNAPLTSTQDTSFPSVMMSEGIGHKVAPLIQVRRQTARGLYFPFVSERTMYQMNNVHYA